MKSIRKFAEEVGHEVVGNLKRRPEWEYTTDWLTGEKYHSGYRHYSDEGGNEYIIGKNGITIVDAEGGVI